MQIRHVIIKVHDQDKALAFYTSVLGFKKVRDDRKGRMRWLTVSSSPKAVELVLESNSAAPSRKSQQTLYDAVFPAAIVSTKDIDGDYRRLKELGVKFRGKPKKNGLKSYAFFDDTCGNYIVLLSDTA
jgi:catechol 2,3-dioxygenase-like lactoylglutathione lyase family enzyme